MRTVLAVGLLLLSGSAPAPVVVTQRGPARVRVQVSEGLTRPCDSSEDKMLFDGWLAHGETFRGAIEGDCVCIRHTRDTFPNADWTTPGLACRPRTCVGKRCVPASDPTIRIDLDPSDR